MGRSRWLGLPGPVFWIALVLLLAAGGLGLYLAFRRPAVEPPTVPTDGLEPAVIRSIEEARAAVRHAPKSAPAWGRLGMILFADQFEDAAHICFQRASQLNPQEPRWPFFDGQVLALHDAEAALALLRRAAELCHDEPDVPRLKLAELLVEQGRYDEAKTHYEALLHRRPDHPLAHLGLARLAYEQGDYSACYQHLQACAGSPFARKAAHALLATVAAQKHDPARAEREHALVARLAEDRAWPDPYRAEIARCRVDRRHRLATIGDLVDGGRLAEAAVALEKLVRDEPDFDIAWQQLGYVRMQEKDFSGAEAALAEALKRNPDSAETCYFLGLALFNEGQPARAADQLRRAVALKPDYAMALLSLGQCLRTLGDRPGAIKALRQAIASRPYLVQAHRDLAELLLADKKPEEARRHLEEAAKLER